ncbi:hypothetical protein M0805_005487 [Coniferiporia weirii]|nr:hypothetical protein M0805_005487 [Coniferiporia weirii]
MAAHKTALRVSLGCMPFGGEGLEGARVHSIDAVTAIVDVFQSHGHVELDTAYAYTGGTSEAFLGALSPNMEARQLQVSTKVYPGKIKHTREDLRAAFKTSLERLKVEKVDIFYLHAPDRTTPFEETFAATDELFKEGKFARLGISNYIALEVAEVVMVCRNNGWVQPTVYQGIYNAIHRAVEPELFPCLRKFGLAFYEYNALGGGFFTGKHTSLASTPEKGTRFDAAAHGNQAQAYLKRYWNEPYFNALAVLRRALDQYNVKLGEGERKLSLTETALRWVSHHSAMKRDHGDCVIIGASSTEYMQENLIALEAGPLPNGIVNAIDEAWELVGPIVRQYWH